jgi:excinuclease ABC subunit C
MMRASANLDYEKAAKIRDQIAAVEKTIERQIVVSPKMDDQDVIGLAKKSNIFQLVILFVRKGYLQGSASYLFKDNGDSPSEIMEAFLKQYYVKGIFIPRQILISEPVDDILSITSWLSELAGTKISIKRPVKGEKTDIVRMALSNAEKLLDGEWENRNMSLTESVKFVLKLKKIPRSIECLDISNFQGDMAVGGIAAFLDGLPRKTAYRNYRIKDFDNIDDYGMMSQLVKRRLGHSDLPDLFLIDGGKGHLNAVLNVLDNFNKAEIPEVVAIAKADSRKKESIDKIYLPGRKNPLNLKKDDPVLFLLMRIRDEAHRRAISYHRKLRSKNLTESSLDLISGIGKKKKEMLLLHFGGISGISRANLEDLTRLPGINITLAKKIITHLTDNG